MEKTFLSIADTFPLNSGSFCGKVYPFLALLERNVFDVVINT